MGAGRWDSGAWTNYQKVHVDPVAKSQRFSSGMVDANDPTKFKFRESRISKENPFPTPVAIGLDVTGSMGELSHLMITGGIDKTMREIYDRKPVSDPHILIGAIGDSKGDRAPLQLTQFEADIRLGDQVKSLWLEGNGQGNDGESYALFALAMAMKTSTDAIEKQGRKGILFSVGDEPVHARYTKAEIERATGIKLERPSMTAAEIYALASRNWNIFHIAVKDGSYIKSYGGLQQVVDSWRPLVGERLIQLDDYNLMPEVIVSALQVIGGADKAKVAASWGRSSAKAIGSAIANLPTLIGPSSGGGLARF